MTFSVLVVEDDPDFSLTLASGLANAGYLVSAAPDLYSAKNKLEEATFSAVLVDLGLPDGSGLTLIKALHIQYQIPSIVVSARGFEAQKIEALDLGASDYLVKPFGMGELLARLRVLLRKESMQEPLRYQFGDVDIDVERRIVLKAGVDIPLSPTEFTLLLELLKANGRLVSHRKLLHAIWGPESIDQTQYLRVYMGKLRSKLEENPASPKLILTELGVGYRANM